MARRRNDDYSSRYQDDLAEMEREFEEKVEAKRRRGFARDYPDSAKRDRKKTKPPLLLRVLAWCGVILFCFVAGYTGTGYLVKMLGIDKPWSALSGGAETGGDAARTMSAELPGLSTAELDIQKTAFAVFYPKNGELVSEKVDVITRTLEDNIQETVHRIFTLSDIGGDAVSVLHVFRDVDTVYLDLSANFLELVNRVGEKAGTLLISGIARTMNDNFSLGKVRFLVASKVVNSGAPVDLSAVWQLQR